ncbi:MAG: ATP-binding cassette domain-containing protein, partial [Clostridiales bacterium]|nr:ATP-binding cassette domain-containing protein [Clostridiales bacterium]
ICGLLVPQAGEIRLYGKSHEDPDVRSGIGALIENPACFPNSTVYQNLMLQALNIGVKNPKEEIARVLRLVSMAGAAGRKFKECSLGMKQRIGVAQALLGRPKLLILDEPINGLDADGMRIVRETLTEQAKQEGVTVLISSHILGELAKIATHYGIIRNGALIREMPASSMSNECRDFVLVNTSDNAKAIFMLRTKYKEVEDSDSGIRVYDEEESSNVTGFLYQHGIAVKEIAFNKVGLEEYYLKVMSKIGA